MSWMQQGDLPPLPRGAEYPLFTRLSLETCSTCTRRCSFCCVGDRGDRLQLMQRQLFDKVISELSDLKWSGVIQWFFLNEPLMDKRCVELVRIARMALPKATIHLTSNGDIADKDTPERLRDAGVNKLNFNAYDRHAVQRLRIMFPNAYDRQDWSAGHTEWRLSVTNMVSPPPESLHSWSNSVEHESVSTRNKTYSACPRPHRHLVVPWNGKVPVCCAVNPVKASVMGDVNVQSLLDVWNSDEMNRYRYLLQLPIRKYDCDGCVEKVAYPTAVRRVTCPVRASSPGTPD